MKWRNTAGKEVSAPKEKWAWRPAVYGVLVAKGKLVFIQPNWDTKFSLPGGSIDLGEDPITAIKREFIEETGLRVEVVGEQPLFIDTQLYGNPEKNQYFQRLSLFYECKLIEKTDNPVDEESTEIIWKEMKKLKPTDFTYFQQGFMQSWLL